MKCRVRSPGPSSKNAGYINPWGANQLGTPLFCPNPNMLQSCLSPEFVTLPLRDARDSNEWGCYNCRGNPCLYSRLSLINSAFFSLWCASCIPIKINKHLPLGGRADPLKGVYRVCRKVARDIRSFLLNHQLPPFISIQWRLSSDHHSIWVGLSGNGLYCICVPFCLRL